MKPKRTRCRTLRRGLPLLLAVLVCAMLAVPVWADDTVESTEADSTETVTVTQEELQEACASLEGQLQDDPETLAILKSAEERGLNATGDVLGVLRRSVDAIQKRRTVISSIQALKEKVQNAQNLEEAQKKTYQDKLNLIDEDLDRAPWRDCLKKLADDPAETVSTADVDAFREEIEDANTEIEQFTEVLNSIPALQSASQQAEFAADYLNNNDQAAKGDAEYAQTLNQQVQDLLKNVYGFFDLSAEDQQGLTGKIQMVTASVDSMNVNVTTASARKTNQLQKQGNQLEGKMVLLYVALGVGGLAVLLGILATILALVKRPNDEGVDVSILASRQDVEKLSAQNKGLSQRLQLQDQKLDASFKDRDEEINALKTSLQEMQRELKRIKGSQAGPAIEPKPHGPKKIGYLNLVYNSYAPENSFLTKCDTPTCYALYDDNSVVFEDTQSGAICTLVGKKSEGLFYLFRPVVDGIELNALDCEKYSGYFKLGVVKSPAKIKQNMGGNYACETKGTVEMVKM